MEDGSIFVCFVCEKEFHQVALLQQHMTDHGTLPEMSNELPSQRKKRSVAESKKVKVVPQNNKSELWILKKASRPTVSTSDILEEHNGSDFISVDQEPILAESKDQQKSAPVVVTSAKNSKSESINSVEKPLPEKKPVGLLESPKPVKVKRFSQSLAAIIQNPIQKTKRSNSKQNTSSLSSKKGDAKKIEEVVVKVENPSFNPVKVKPDPDGPSEFSIAMQRAMKIKKYIERKENTAEKKLEKSEHDLLKEEEDEVDNIYDMEDTDLGGAKSSIMMVDSSFFNSGMSKPPVGPTIMNSEPDGFMVPEKISLSTHLQRKKSLYKKNEKLLFQEMYLSNNSEEENGGADDIQPVHDQMQGRSLGSRRRGVKRGKPPKSRDYVNDDADDSVEEIIPLKSRRGRKPKKRDNSDESSDQIYQCLECYKEFRSLTAMRIHVKSHSQDREIPCPYCDEIFPQRYILYEHLVNDHEDSDSLTCPVCNKIFTRTDSLKSHMVRMHEENGGLNCVMCGKNFPSQGQLEMHVRVHTGERPFKCELCRKGFVQKVHLRTHLRTMHNMADANTTPCRLCEEMFSGRASLREHYISEHGLSTAQYKTQVAKLRKEGKIPEIVPPKVKIVDPSFRYQKVNVSEVDEMPVNEPPQLSSYVDPLEPAPSTENGVSEKKTSTLYLTRSRGRKLKIKTKLSSKRPTNTPGMGTVMNLASDDLMFTPMNFDLDSDEPKGRDQEELNIVESAFKVAEEMDQLRDGSSTLLMTDDSSSSGIYYSLPIDADDEYAQFAAEHAHIDGVEDAEFDSKDDHDALATPTTVSSKTNRRGAIVKAEPLEIYSDSMGSAPQAVEMLTM